MTPALPVDSGWRFGPRPELGINQVGDNKEYRMNVNLTTMNAIIGAVTGSVSLVLGVYNLVQNLSQRRVRLKVVPKLTAIRGAGFLSNSVDLVPDGFACIEVTNLSAFPLTIAEVGFSLDGEVGRAVVRPDPTTLLPKRLEPRESIDVRATRSAGFPKKAKRGYATTQCDHTCYGDSLVLSKWRKMSR
jgi:hypothetical protein